MPKGEQGLETFRLVPFVTDGGALVIGDRDAGVIGRAHAGDGGMRQLRWAGGKADRQVAAGVHLARQHLGNRLPAARAGIPRLQHRRHLRQPRRHPGSYKRL